MVLNRSFFEKKEGEVYLEEVKIEGGEGDGGYEENKDEEEEARPDEILLLFLIGRGVLSPKEGRILVEGALLRWQVVLRAHNARKTPPPFISHRS